MLDASQIEVQFNGFVRTLCASLECQFEQVKNYRNSCTNVLFCRIDRFIEEMLQIQQYCGVITGSVQQLHKKNCELSGYLQRIVPTFDFDNAVKSIEIFSEENVNLKVEMNGLKQKFALLQSENLTLMQSLEVYVGIS